MIIGEADGVVCTEQCPFQVPKRELGLGGGGRHVTSGDGGGGGDLKIGGRSVSVQHARTVPKCSQTLSVRLASATPHFIPAAAPPLHR